MRIFISFLLSISFYSIIIAQRPCPQVPKPDVIYVVGSFNPILCTIDLTVLNRPSGVFYEWYGTINGDFTGPVATYQKPNLTCDVAGYNRCGNMSPSTVRSFPGPCTGGCPCFKSEDPISVLALQKFINLSISPIPTSDELNIDNLEKVQNVSLINNQGQLILSKNTLADDTKISLNVSQFPNGLYLLRINNFEGEYVTKKITISHL